MFSVPGTVYKVLCEHTFAVLGTVPEPFLEQFQVSCEQELRHLLA